MAWLLGLIVGLVVGWSGDAGARPVKFSLTVSPREGTRADTYVATVHIEVAGITGVDRYWEPIAPEFEVVNSQITGKTTTATAAAKIAE